MGAGDRAPERRDALTGSSGVVRVVPDLATFSVDDGFAYEVAEGTAVSVGSIVRVPLGGRRVRGWVTAVGEERRRSLRAVLGVSGDRPVFDPGLLQVLRWAAIHYVAPLPALLAKAAPPNLPRRPGTRDPAPVPDLGPSPLPDVSLAAAAGERRRALVWQGAGPWGGPMAAAAAPILAAGRSVVVVAATVLEAAALGAELGEAFGERVVVGTSALDAATVTAAWSEAAGRGGLVVVGTREVAFWPVSHLAAAFVVEDGRRGLKDKATPTTHARDVLWRRAAVERFTLVTCGPVPTGEALARGPEISTLTPGRVWGLVEVVDRTEDPPGSGFVASRTRAALHAVTAAGGRAFVFAHRRSPALRCVRCRALRLCPVCGAHPGRADACPRCGAEPGPCGSCSGTRFEALGADLAGVAAEARRFLGSGLVGEPGSGAAVVVGTERDLLGTDGFDLAVIVDADGLLRAPVYRAGEEGLRVMARLVAAAGKGRGRRAMVQTADPGHPAIEALRRADPVPFVRADVAARAALGFPPGGGEMLVIEVGGRSGDADASLREALEGHATLHGPAQRRDRLRWLVQGPDLRPAKVALRATVQELRERGARVRIDADPLDL